MSPFYRSTIPLLRKPYALVSGITKKSSYVSDGVSEFAIVADDPSIWPSVLTGEKWGVKMMTWDRNRTINQSSEQVRKLLPSLFCRWSNTLKPVAGHI